MHLPLLISKASWIKLKMFQNDYKIGYLLKDDNKCYCFKMLWYFKNLYE